MHIWFIETNFALQALLATLFTYFVTVMGSAVVFLFKKVNKSIMDAMLGFAGGVMIAASFWSLLSPASEMAENLSMTPWLVTFTGFFAGGGLLFFFDKIFSQYLKKKQSHLTDIKSEKKRSFMLIYSITLHNIPEGLAVGTAFGAVKYGLEGASIASACLLALGIGLQNFPEGTAVSVPLYRDGYTKKKAFFIGQLSAIVEPIAGVAGALLVMNIIYILPFMLSFAAGAMIYVVVEEIIPESQSNEKKDLMALFTLVGFSVMMILDMALGG